MNQNTSKMILFCWAHRDCRLVIVESFVSLTITEGITHILLSAGVENDEERKWENVGIIILLAHWPAYSD